MEPLRITTFQAYLFWENIEKNLTNLALRLTALRLSTDLIVLPEMFNTGFTMNTEMCAEKMDGLTMRWMREQAEKYECVVTGSLIIEEDNKFYNRLIWMREDGSYEYYDKRHLFAYGKEDEQFTAGEKTIIIDLKGWKISPMICYDLRFPVWSRNVDNKYDILLYVASWPDSRIDHWQKLIPARAIENQAFVVAVNRVGYDGNEIYHPGCSMCISPNGETIYYKPENEDLFTSTLYVKDLKENRERYKFFNDAEKFSLTED